MKAWVLAFVLLGLCFGALSASATDSGAATVTMVQLRVESRGHIADLVIPLGEFAALGRPEEGDSYRIRPTAAHLDSSQGVDIQLSSVRILNGVAHETPVSATTLRLGGDAYLLTNELPVHIELSGMKKAPRTANLRPESCCVTCDGQTFCAHCASANCGSCCVVP